MDFFLAINFLLDSIKENCDWKSEFELLERINEYTNWCILFNLEMQSHGLDRVQNEYRLIGRTT